ncbi:MAG: hypothetical protein J1F22_08235 [Lachnospiraceae bacterium]|nr:hypothetical protein [Lachnospiraceae bacterium]
MKADVILKKYGENKSRFADLFNTVFFKGNSVLHAMDLQDIPLRSYL